MRGLVATLGSPDEGAVGGLSEVDPRFYAWFLRKVMGILSNYLECLN